MPSDYKILNYKKRLIYTIRYPGGYSGLHHRLKEMLEVKKTEKQIQKSFKNKPLLVWIFVF